MNIIRPKPDLDTGGEFSGSATMPATALVRGVESARESRPAELFAVNKRWTSNSPPVSISHKARAKAEDARDLGR